MNKSPDPQQSKSLHDSTGKKGGAAEKRTAARIVGRLGPGLVTGASDDDPSGIGTYSQVGAQFGYGMLWTMVFTYPLMAGIQEISAQIGRVTGHGIAGIMRRYYSPWLTYSIVTLMVIANTINIGADVAAMGTAVKLLIGGPALLYSLFFASITVILLVFVSYCRYIRFLKWLTLVLFAYVGTAFAVNVPWMTALKGSALPAIALTPECLTAFIAVLGTTISPYLFFWQASQEGQEVAANRDEHALKRAPEEAPAQLKRIKIDTYLGMAFSNAVGFFIILAAAATLHSSGTVTISTAAEAAEALRPIAGDFAFLLFSLGIIGTGLLALPVLAGSTAYAMGELLRWPVGLQKKPYRAKGFYSVVALATLGGLEVNFMGIDPIKALFWAAVINGIVAVPVMIVMMFMVASKEVMGIFVVPKGLKTVGWVATAVMLFAVVGLVVTTVL